MIGNLSEPFSNSVYAFDAFPAAGSSDGDNRMPLMILATGTVVVNADEGVNYGLVVKVMDQARRIGVRKFALATEASGVDGVGGK